MIAAHRRRHRWMFVLLALLVPLLVALALAARPESPLNPDLPTAAASFPDDRR